MVEPTGAPPGRGKVPDSPDDVIGALIFCALLLLCAWAILRGFIWSDVHSVGSFLLAGAVTAACYAVGTFIDRTSDDDDKLTTDASAFLWIVRAAMRIFFGFIYLAVALLVIGIVVGIGYVIVTAIISGLHEHY